MSKNIRNRDSSKIRLKKINRTFTKDLFSKDLKINGLQEQNNKMKALAKEIGAV